MGIKWGVLAGFVLAVVGRADEIDDRVRAIEDGVSRAVGELQRVAGDSDGSRVNSAIDSVSRTKEHFEKLKSLSPASDLGRSMASLSLDWIESFRRAAEALRTEKQNQTAFKTLSDECTLSEDQLLGTVRAYLGAPEDAAEGRRVIAERAERFAGDITQKLNAVTQKLQEQERLRDEVRRFSFDESRFRALKEALHSAAESVYSDCRERVEKSKSACAQLVQGTKASAVSDALSKLSNEDERVKLLLERIQGNYNDWKSRRSALKPGGRFRQENADKLLQAFCDADEMQIQDRVQRVADEVASVMGSAQQEFLAKLKQLIDELQALDKTKTPGLKNEIARQRRNMQAAYKTLDDAKSLGLLRGRNNPKINMYLENGVKKHQSFQSGCTAMEYELEGGRVDCVKVGDPCQVIEIKPNSPTAISAGNEQLRKRKDDLERLLADKKLGDRNALMMRCVKDGRLNVTYELLKYEYCPVGVEQIDVTREEVDP